MSDPLSFDTWYSDLCHVSVESRIISEIPKEYVDHLLENGIMMSSDSDGECEVLIRKQITQHIEELGGRVFLRTNRRSCKDAKWITVGKTLYCCNYDDVKTLLKSSDNTYEDIKRSQQCGNANPFIIALTRWIDIGESSVFRCFVYENELVGICQKDLSEWYPFLVKEEQNIIDQSKSFFHKHIKEILGDRHLLKNYTMDIYIDMTKIRDPLLIDLGDISDPRQQLLFSEVDFAEPCRRNPTFKYVQSEDGVRRDTASENCIPLEFLNCDATTIMELYETMEEK